MSLKYKIKEKLPEKAFNFLKSTYLIGSAYHYWIPYAFKRGRTYNPKEITIELTYRCNLKCVMCPQSIDYLSKDSKLLEKHRQVEELKKHELKSIIDNASLLGIKHIALTGGEIFLREDIFEIIESIKAKKMICSILTNGVLIKEREASKLVALGIDKITFSLDGPEKIHNEIRRDKNAYRNLINAVKFIKEEKIKRGSILPYLALTCTISSLNAPHLSELFNIADDLGIGITYGYLFYTNQTMNEKTNEIIKIGDAKEEDQNIPSELKKIDIEILKEEIKKINTLKNKSRVKVSFQPPLNENEIAKRFYDDFFTYTSKCFYPWYAMRINPYGEVYPCSMNIIMGNIREERIEDIWNNKKYVEFRKALKRQGIFPRCTKCCKLNYKFWSYLPSFSWIDKIFI